MKAVDFLKNDAEGLREPLSGPGSAGPLPTSVTESSVPECRPALSEPNSISSGPKGVGFSSSLPEKNS
jgi:hypothetical protein